MNGDSTNKPNPGNAAFDAIVPAHHEPQLAHTSQPSCAFTYVAGLTGEAGKSGMRSAFIRAARLLFPSGVAAVDEPSYGGMEVHRCGWTWDTAAAIRWELLQPVHAAHLRSKLTAQVEQREISPATANLTLAAVRGALKVGWLWNAIDRDQLARVHEALKSIRATRPLAGRHIPTPELAALFAHLSTVDGYGARRDAAAFALMRSPGLRRAEVCGLDLADLAGDCRTLQVVGKGGKSRTVHLTNGTLDAVQHFMEIRGQHPGPLFQPVNRWGQLQPRHMTTAGLHEALRSRARAAGVPAIRCHDLRRTFAGEALTAGIDLPTLQTIMGHASPVTTSRYDRRPDEQRKAAMQTVCIPYMAPPNRAA
jgi:integrase